MFKTTSARALCAISLSVVDWACSEKNGRFSRLYRVVIAISSPDVRVEPGTIFEPYYISVESTWSQALQEIEEQMYQVLTYVDEDTLFFSNPGDYCERLDREINAILPTHDNQDWSNGK